MHSVNLMVKHSDDLDPVFRALADPTRRALLTLLEREPATVGALAQRFDMSLPALMKHLRLLEHAGLVATQKTGRVRTCALRPEPLAQAEAWLARRQRFVAGRLGALQRHLDGDAT